MNNLSQAHELSFYVEDTDYGNCFLISSDGLYDRGEGEGLVRVRHVLATVDKKDLSKLYKALEPLIET